MAADRYLAYPFRLDAAGNVAWATARDNVRHRLLQVLLTSPGERVMLPEFGSGLRDRLFAPNDDVMAAATEFTVARALQAHLGSDVMINKVDITATGEALVVSLVFTWSADLQQERMDVRVAPFVARGDPHP